MNKAEIMANLEFLADRIEKAEFLISKLKHDTRYLIEILENEFEKEKDKTKEPTQSKQNEKSRGIF